MRNTPSHNGLTATLIVLLALGLNACDRSVSGTSDTSTTAASTSSSAKALEPDVLVSVNGVPIRVADLHYVLARENKGRGPGGEIEAKAALDAIIDQELARQEAESLDLDRDPDYLRKLRFMEAPLNDFKRSELRDRYLAKKVEAEAAVSEAEARKYFDAHRDKLQTEVELHKILVRGNEAKLQAMKAQIDGGTPFEEVAAEQFPAELPEGAPPPWAMGPLRWHQVPAPFVDAVAQLKEGEVSGIIRGPKERAWIVKLVKRRVNEAITFESIKPQVMGMIQSDKAAEVQKRALAKMRQGATIVRHREVEAMPPPPDPGDE
jgi:EpsD family peptidyl-prolyl cis-trans isomerase